ncbi:hypothetical protein HY572_00900 [Candidatus Micrarchaeota archaeon]|nr:hypothetical protein [Candidatus Micrarchaeota archaeon]
MADEPTIEEMVQLLKKRRFLPFGHSSYLAIFIAMLEKPLSKAEMQEIAGPTPQGAFIRIFAAPGVGFMNRVFGKSKQGSDIVKYELTENGRQFVLDQLDLLKTFYKATEPKKE